MEATYNDFAKEDILPVGSNLFFAALLPLISFASVLTASFYLPIAIQSAPSFQGDFIVLFHFSKWTVSLI